METKRWVRGNGIRIFEPIQQCPWCGSFACNGQIAECMLCGSAQCHGNGSGNGCCAICHHGYLPGWSRGYSKANARECSYKGCVQPAVATCRKRAVCLDHAKRIKATKDLTLAEYVAERIAHRDSGKGWEAWRLVS